MQHQDVSIEISIPDQTLTLVEKGQVTAEYPISSAKNGLGNDEGSFKTPLGEFEIAECIGAEEPMHTIFRGRKPVGIWPEDEPEDTSDLILSRILWLNGLEDDNSNTHSRYIYIHATNHENLLGTPCSQGCIRVSNRDMIQLFDKVQTGTKVKIVDYRLRPEN